MATATLSVRVDEDLKKQFDGFCSDIGMNASTAVNVFIKAALREQRIPFDVASSKYDPFYSAQNIQRLERAARDMDARGGTPHELVEVLDD